MNPNKFKSTEYLKDYHERRGEGYLYYNFDQRSTTTWGVKFLIYDNSNISTE